MTAEEHHNRRDLYRFALGFGLAAILALFLLSLVLLTGLRREEHTLVSPIEVTGIPEGYVMVRQSHARAKIRVSGTPADLDHMELLRLQVTLPDHPAMEGSYPVTLRREEAPSVEILEITPSEIHIRLAESVQKNIPVTVRLVGSPAPGFRLGEVTVTPAVARVSGPSEVVRDITAIRTTAVSVSDATAPLSVKVPAEHVPGKGRLTLCPELFTVRVQVKEIHATRRLAGIPITTGPDESRRISITPSTVDISVTGPARLVDKLRAATGISAVIDTRGLASGIYVRRAAITLPRGVDLISASPELFTVTVPGS
ncbi:CdaR family protein [Desulfoluna butyratoxydans]|uniref:Ybbr-like n=1 Tax=Desulfoluna butyratoxydans TaxID=231438 RepID=A0A4U8YNY4_9BACT|nr:CdaR family protein [Desulfoluna butyratoxydans]VFQ45885.1 ybbr-like [Desulfoluna butyratoxydans]